MIPKVDVKYIYEDSTVRQTLETEGHYKGIISEGHLLWYVIKGESGEPHTMAVEALEKFHLSDVDYLKAEDEKGMPVSITAPIEDLIMRAMNVNFVPIVDDRQVFVGIVTRSAIIRHFYDKNIKGREKGGT